MGDALSVPFIVSWPYRYVCGPKGYGFCTVLVWNRVWISGETTEMHERIYRLNSK